MGRRRPSLLGGGEGGRHGRPPRSGSAPRNGGRTHFASTVRHAHKVRGRHHNHSRPRRLYEHVLRPPMRRRMHASTSRGEAPQRARQSVSSRIPPDKHQFVPMRDMARGAVAGLRQAGRNSAIRCISQRSLSVGPRSRPEGCPDVRTRFSRSPSSAPSTRRSWTSSGRRARHRRRTRRPLTFGHLYPGRHDEEPCPPRSLVHCC